MSTDCPHCGHAWDEHSPCTVCGCKWPPPTPQPVPQPPRREYPYDGVIDAGLVYKAFWAAADIIHNDPNAGPFTPYFDQSMDMVDTSGCGMPSQFWDLMARALADGD